MKPPKQTTITEVELCNRLRESLSNVARLMTEADSRGLDVNFSIRKGNDRDSNYQVGSLVINKRLVNEVSVF